MRLFILSTILGSWLLLPHPLPTPWMDGNSELRMAASGKPSVQPYLTYIIPITTVLRWLPTDYDCLPCPMAIRAELGGWYLGVAGCNIELQNDANFSYCMHSINPLYSIVISTTTITITAITITTNTITTITITTITITTITITTITITTITITTITITSIGYFPPRLFFHEIM